MSCSSGPRRRDVAPALGQLLPRDAELDGPASRASLRRGRPDGYMARDEVVGYLERYAAASPRPSARASRSTSLRRGADGGFELERPRPRSRAATVVLAHGRLPAPAPAGRGHAARGPAADRRRRLPQSGGLPGGGAVVGSGQSGCQIAEELREAGREVFLACGRAPWSPRRIGDHDLLWWALETGFLDAPLSSLPHPAARLFGNILATGTAAAMTSTPHARGWGDAAGPFPRRRRSPRPLRAGSRRQRRLGGSALNAVHELFARSRPNAACRPEIAEPGPLRRPARGARSPRLRSRDLRRWLSARLRVLVDSLAHSTTSGSRSTTRAPARRPGPVLHRHALPAQAQVIAARRRGRTRRSSRGRSPR